MVHADPCPAPSPFTYIFFQLFAELFSNMDSNVSAEQQPDGGINIAVVIALEINYQQNDLMDILQITWEEKQL